MNPEAREELDRILGIEPVALSDAEIAFLRARRDYLTEEQKAVYAEALADVNEPPAQAEETAEVETAEEAPRSRRGRRTSEEA